MPPKVINAGTAAMGNDAFLAACIKHAKEKLTVDFEALAIDIGMSKGGAANKFRAIMKQLEDGGAAWAKDGEAGGESALDLAKTPARKRKAAPKTTPKAIADNEANGNTSVDGSENDGEALAPKRTKREAKKGTAKPVAKKRAEENKAKEQNEEEDVESQSAPGAEPVDDDGQETASASPMEH